MDCHHNGCLTMTRVTDIEWLGRINAIQQQRDSALNQIALMAGQLAMMEAQLQSKNEELEKYQKLMAQKPQEQTA